MPDIVDSPIVCLGLLKENREGQDHCIPGTEPGRVQIRIDASTA